MASLSAEPIRIDTLTYQPYALKPGRGLCGHLRLRQCHADGGWNDHNDALDCVTRWRTEKSRYAVRAGPYRPLTIVVPLASLT